MLAFNRFDKAFGVFDNKSDAFELVYIELLGKSIFLGLIGLIIGSLADESGGILLDERGIPV